MTEPGTTESDRRIDLLGLSRERLAELLEPWVDHAYRVDQVWHALHHQRVAEVGEITTLSLDLRQRLAGRFRVGLPEEEARRLSRDGTLKLVFRLADGATVETVDIPDGGRRTLCLSSQAGCALACAFCVTGYWGAGRDLTAGEIVGQVAAVRREHGDEVGGVNLVFMGMGEPLLNLGAVRDALGVLTETISWRRITVSTVGILPGIEAIARWPRRPNLAISLHAPDEERRSLLMPANRTWPLADLLATLRGYPLEAGRRITIEYLLVEEFNDHPSDAESLVRRLADPERFKVNLIPVNPDPVLGESMVPPPPGRVEAFRRRLEKRGMVATVRRRRGDDVSAACGQLRAPGRPPRGFRQGALSW